ncbi:hypothetical protein [Propionicimonas paludicola]|uniref:hypothetical protein n=1 Tax=Propionicimonas paludicola TaxID=185243 RepID=UPI00117A8AB1|nr:hypothetical protein [Propionicimonas paludicola]
MERAWTELRLAEEAYYAAIPDPDKAAAVASTVLAEAKAQLDPTDPRTVALAKAMKTHPVADHLGALTEPLLAAGIAAHSASDLGHRAQRQFRGLLRAITLGLAALAVLVGVTVMVVPVPSGWLPVPTGIPTGAGIVLAMVVGAFGALFPAVPSLSQAPANPTTYSPDLVQALLKIVVGAWSALVGLVAVSAGVQAAPTGGSSVAGFVLMCAVFGASQEALTRFADHKAAATKPTTT